MMAIAANAAQNDGVNANGAMRRRANGGDDGRQSDDDKSS